MSERVIAGRVRGTVADVVDLGLELLPDYELAAVPILDGAERPAEWPAVRRRLRAEGIRAREHRGVLLLTPGELERASSVGVIGAGGGDELYLCGTWEDEFEAYAHRITSDFQDFNEGTPLGLEEWMIMSGCLLAVGDGPSGLNFATSDDELAERLRRRFQAAKG
ncbi:MAG TPA: hypothetical protein VEY91_12425 [Candidatus Limnocylindria bacterium]|nr:hypothetical protein [Candidatus Limnocylindria bacterium]